MIARNSMTGKHTHTHASSAKEFADSAPLCDLCVGRRKMQIMETFVYKIAVLALFLQGRSAMNRSKLAIDPSVNIIIRSNC
jgi:hypothetical protein